MVGIISSFDVMFEGDRRDELGERMFPFLDACRSEAAGLFYWIASWGEGGFRGAPPRGLLRDLGGGGGGLEEVSHQGAGDICPLLPFHK